MGWRLKSLLISIGLNVLFLMAACVWIIWPLTPGLLPVFKICDFFDPGSQPNAPACSGWHGTVTEIAGVILNVGIYWLVIWSVGVSLRAASRRPTTESK